jgi:hypothetical protein
MIERIAIFIDGSNFYHYLRELELKHLAEFDYQAFAQFLARKRTIVSSTYYIGKLAYLLCVPNGFTATYGAISTA